MWIFRCATTWWAVVCIAWLAGGAERPGQTAGEPEVRRPDETPPAAAVRRADEPPLAKPGGGWQVAPDPPATPLALPEGTKIAIRVPSRGTRPLVLFPSAPSPFVATGSNQLGQVRRLWDLRNGQQVGTIDADIPGAEGDKVALSPDGKHLATWSFAWRGEIQIWSFATGKRVQRLELSSPTALPCFFDFAGPDRLVGGSTSDQGYQVWDIHTGEVVATIPVRPSYAVGRAISPGGTYIAVFSIMDNKIRIFDTRNGVEAGVLECRGRAQTGMAMPEGLAFSPDGKQLAGWFRVGLGRKLLCWEMTDGRRVAEHSFAEDPTADLLTGAYRGPVLEWFPGQRGWLLKGVALVDRDTGRVIWVDRSVRSAYGLGQRRVVDAQRLLAVVGPPGQQELRVISISEEEVAAGRKVVRGGGTAADIGLPPITVADRSAAEVLMLAGRRGTWKYRPLPAAADWDRAAVQLGIPWHSVRGVFFTAAQHGRAVVGKHLGRSARGWDSGTQLAEVYDTYDLSSGQQIGRFDVPFATELVALSPRGDRGVFRAAQGKDRLDVWDLASGRHIAGFRPYQEEDRPSRAVTWAAMPDETHVLTLNSKSQLVCWELPKCRAVYSAQLSHQDQSALSPDRQAVIAVVAGETYVLAAATGELLGTLAPVQSKQKMIFRAAKFSADGQRLAILYFIEKDQSFLAVWSLDDGRLLSQMALPMAGFDLVWCGRDHVMIDPGGLPARCPLVEVERSLVVWRYEVENGRHVWETVDGRHWFVAGQDAGGAASLLAVSLPDAEAARLIASAPAPRPLLSAGGAASIEVRLETAPGTSEPVGLDTERLRRELEEHFANQLRRLGVRVVPYFPVRVLVAIQEKRIEADVAVGSPFGRRDTIVLSTSVVIPSIAVVGPEGTMAWGKKSLVDKAPSGSLEEKPAGMDLTSFLRLKYWLEADRWLREQEIPLPIYDPSTKEGLGLSVLTPSGARTIRRPAPKPTGRPVRKA